MNQIDTLFAELRSLQAEKSLPPVHLWHPDHVGKIDIRIDAEGVWFHEGRAITRTAIARVFSSILRRDGEDYFLVTPQEKLRIEVEDVPFVVVDAQVRGEGAGMEVIVSTNLDDHVVLSHDHHLEMRGDVPYVHIRAGLFARITRNIFYTLVEYGHAEADTWCLYSDGVRFELGEV